MAEGPVSRGRIVLGSGIQNLGVIRERDGWGNSIPSSSLEQLKPCISASSITGNHPRIPY